MAHHTSNIVNCTSHILHLTSYIKHPASYLSPMEEVKQKPGKLRILFRLAFICNVFFFVCMILRYSSAPQYIPQPLIEFAIILGWFAPLINFINFVLAIISLSHMSKKEIPRWLLYTNIICFVFQIYFFFILKDVPYT